MSVDIVDTVTETTAPLRALRKLRPVTVEQLQASFDALFTPSDDADFTVPERHLVAAFTTRLAGADDATAAFYADRALISAPDAAAVVLVEAADAAASGPFGHFSEDGLQAENSDGKRYSASQAVRDTVGARLAAALEHAHLLTLRPREAGAQHVEALTEAGWSPDSIVTLAQLVAFLAFQQRVVAGLRVLQQSGLGNTETGEQA